MGSTFSAPYVKLVDQATALRTVELLLLLRIVRRLPREQVDRQKLICLSFLLRDRFQPLQLVERLAAFLETTIEVRSNCDEAVHILSLQLFLVLNQSHGSLHGSIVVFLIQLPLAKQVEVNCFSAFPRIRQCLVCR